MKLTFTAILLLMFPTSILFGQTETPSKTQSNEAKSYLDVADANWKEVFDQRMKTYQAAAKSIRVAIEKGDVQEMGKSVSAIAEQLPVGSFHSKQLLDISKKLRQPSSSDLVAGEEQFEKQKSQLKTIADQMAFRPRLETEMPERFPAPTPVGEIEFKSYPAYRMARTEVEGKPTNGSDEKSFFRLFNHIQSNDIAMTSPVEMIYQQSEKGLKEATMAFLYENPRIGETNIDESANVDEKAKDDGQANKDAEDKKPGEVTVIDVKPKKVIAMGLRGRPDKKRIEQAAKTLRERSLAYTAKFSLADQVRVLGYNGPSVPQADQFYEVQIELKEKPPTSRAK